MTRLEAASAIYNEGMERVKTTPVPIGQKFPPGSRVRIAGDLGEMMRYHRGAGKTATVEYTYAHAYGGNNVTQYALSIDGLGWSAWYFEGQLTHEPS